MTDNKGQISFILNEYISAFLKQKILPSVDDRISGNACAIVSSFFLKKATKTLEAICVLCTNSLAEDGLVLGRTLLELCFCLKYIAQPQLPEEQKNRAESFIYDGDRQRVEKLKELERLKEEGKCLAWIDDLQASNPIMETVPIPSNFVPLKKLKDIAKELGGEMESNYHFVYWSISKLTHPSGLGSHTYLQNSTEENEISRALAIAFPMHYLLTQVALDMLGLQEHQTTLDEYAKKFIGKDQ